MAHFNWVTKTSTFEATKGDKRWQRVLSSKHDEIRRSQSKTDEINQEVAKLARRGMEKPRHVYIPLDLVELIEQEVPAGSLNSRTESVLRWYFQGKRTEGKSQIVKKPKFTPSAQEVSDLDEPIPGF